MTQTRGRIEWFGRCHLTTLALGSLALILSSAAMAEEWGYEVMPFLWTSGIDGSQGFDGNVSDVTAEFSDLVELVDVGAALRVRAYRPPWGWYGEVDYVKLGDDVTTPIGKINVQSEQTLLDAGLNYDLSSTVAIYAGLRYQQVDLAINAPVAHVSRNKGWTDAVAGVRWTPVQSEHWVAWARGDAGGGSSDLVWLAEVGGGYRWGTRWGTYLSYRLLDTDYESDSFLYDVRQEGLLLGFGVRF